ncbi:hypothetical protein IFM89_029499 [Coptis chinensis]|uniref:ERAP1-like C-terminal domain-containing protein n=1 Tax=Coptis chinensis TaxID=261450 RepID=A0A835HVL3_9MAGN|nr:hypothetical protein IFM89_029499 [Coptis chinensis]
MDISELLGTSSATNNHQKWFKINVDQTGFYRVKYDDELAGRLRYAIEANHLSAIDRFGILDDSYALSMACKQSLSSLFRLMIRTSLPLISRLLIPQVSNKVAKVADDACPDLSEYIKLFLINLFQNSTE